jgi:hypothetical protein
VWMEGCRTIREVTEWNLGKKMRTRQISQQMQGWGWWQQAKKTLKDKEIYDQKLWRGRKVFALKKNCIHR